MALCCFYISVVGAGHPSNPAGIHNIDEIFSKLKICCLIYTLISTTVICVTLHCCVADVTFLLSRLFTVT